MDTLSTYQKFFQNFSFKIPLSYRNDFGPILWTKKSN